MLLKIFKKIFWCNLDHLGKNILLSLIWIVLNSPVFFLIITLFLKKNHSITLYVILVNFLLLSPITAGMFHATLPMINSEGQIRAPVLLFEGIGKFWWRALLLYCFSTLLILLGSNAISFYLKQAIQMSMVLRILVSGLAFWVLIYLLFMQISFLPLLVRLDLKIGQVIHKSFLLVLGNPGQHVFFGFFSMISFAIALLSVLGFILLWSGFFALSVNIFSLGLLSKYNQTIILEEETRTFKHLIKPWEP